MIKSRIYIAVATSLLTASLFAQKVTEPKIGSAERTAIMNSMRGPVSKAAKKTVIFTGSVSVYKNWAKLNGHVKPKDGTKFSDEMKNELDFIAILKKVDGKWQTLHFGWAGDIGVLIEAKKKYPNIPDVLVPNFPE